MDAVSGVEIVACALNHAMLYKMNFVVSYGNVYRLLYVYSAFIIHTKLHGWKNLNESMETRIFWNVVLNLSNI